MKTNSMKVLAIACGAALTLVSGVSMAESQYGYNSAGMGTVTAQATVKLSVTVPKLILLKVGSSDTGSGPAVAVQDTLAWTATISIPGVPTTPATGNNTGVNWSGAAPTVTAGTNPGAISVSAWTNGTGATINCAAPTWTPASGGLNGDFAVTATGSTAASRRESRRVRKHRDPGKFAGDRHLGVRAHGHAPELGSRRLHRTGFVYGHRAVN